MVDNQSNKEYEIGWTINLPPKHKHTNILSQSNTRIKIVSEWHIYVVEMRYLANE